MKIISAFRQYEAYSITANNKRRRDYFKLPEEDRKLLEALGWKARLDKVDECIAVNGGVLRTFVENPEIFMDEEDMMYANDGQSTPEHTHRTDWRNLHRRVWRRRTYGPRKQSRPFAQPLTWPFPCSPVSA